MVETNTYTPALRRCRLEILSLLSRTLGAELDRAAWLELLNGQCRGHFWVVVDGAELQTTLIKVHNDLVALFMVKTVDGGDVDRAQTVAGSAPEERDIFSIVETLDWKVIFQGFYLGSGGGLLLR